MVNENLWVGLKCNHITLPYQNVVGWASILEIGCADELMIEIGLTWQNRELVNFDVEISPTIDSNGKHQTIGIKLIIKADKASKMPSMEKISHIIKEVHNMVIKSITK